MIVASAPPLLHHPHTKPAGLRKSAPQSSSLQRWKSLAKEASLVLAGQVAAGLGSLIAVRVLTGLLPPAAFGEFALSLTLVTILQYCYAGTSAAAMRFFVPAAEQGQAEAYLIAAWRLQHRRGLLVVLLVLGGLVCLLATGYTSLLPTMAAALAIAVINSYGMFMDGLQNAARQRAVVALHQGASSLLRLGCAVLLVTWIGVSAASVLWDLPWAPP